MLNISQGDHGVCRSLRNAPLGDSVPFSALQQFDLANKVMEVQMKSHVRFYRLFCILILVSLLLPFSPTPSAQGRSTITADTIPPAPVTNLVASTGTTPGAFDLSWIAPGDDGTAGSATAYIVRYNTEPITKDNWAVSTDIPGELSPQPAGSVER